MSRPRTAQGQAQTQRSQARPESSIPIPHPLPLPIARPKSIPTLRRPQTIVPPLPLAPSRSQFHTQVQGTQAQYRQGPTLSRKPSIPLRNTLLGKSSSNRLRSPALSSLPAGVAGRERKGLPIRSALNVIPKSKLNPTTTTITQGQRECAPPSPLPSINSIPVVNRLNRKVSVPILPRATNIAASTTTTTATRAVSNPKQGKKLHHDDVFLNLERPKEAKAAGMEKVKEKRKEVVPANRPIQRMTMRGIKFIRPAPNIFKSGQGSEDLSIDMVGMSSSPCV